MPQPTIIENFVTDTGQFVVIGGGSVGPSSFVFAGGQGTFTNPGGRDATNAYDTNMPVAAGPSIFVYATIGTPVIPVPSAGTYTNICAGIYKDAGNQIMIEFGSTPNPLIYDVDILFFGPGGQHNLTILTQPTSSPPEAVGFNLEGNIATTLARFSGVWHVLTTFDVSGIYDFTAPGAITGWYAGAGLDSDSGGSVAINQLWSGPPIIATAPNVVGELFTAASSDIVAAGLIVGTFTAVASAFPPGTVLTQSPVAGSVVLAGSTVTGTQSAGVVVPNIVNTSLAVVAPSILAAAGFVVGAVAYAPSVLIIAGNIISQSPIAGALATSGSAVNVVVSSGRGPIAVPDLIGLTQANAIIALVNIGLVPGSIGVTSSTTVPAGIVISQNIGPGIPYPIYLASGSIVGFVVSSGPPPTDTLFNYGPTVISQYANSPTLLQWLDNMNQYMDQATNFANFLSYVWNVDSAVGFGLDIWGKIVNVSRLLRIPNTTPYVGFDIASESQPAQDWTPAGSNQPPYNNPPVGGAMYTGHNATEAYLLDDNSYRQLILAKAFANICSTTAPALNQILQNLYGAGQAYVLYSGVMAITYNFNFKPSPIQLAILEQSGVIPTPPGVAFSIVTP